MTGVLETGRQQMLHQFDLTGRTAIVTGGTRGIGWAISKAFVDLGASVVVASRKAEACAEAERALIGRGGQAVGIPVNLGDLAAGPALVEVAVERFGRLDIVVNNAATALTQPLGDFTPDGWAKVYDVDARGPVFLVQAALPYLKQSPCASVVNVISPGAFTFAASTALYSSAKAALVSLTRSMAAAYAPWSVRVNALCPGPTDTDMVRNNPPEAQKTLAGSCLLNRLADPREMTGPAVFLASDAASFMTGQILLVDGGMVPH